MKKISKRLVFLALSLMCLFSGQPFLAYAATVNSQPSAKISFTFDDAYQSAFTQAAPTLAKYGLTGVEYVPTGCVGMVLTPNTCQADNDKSYMTWDQVVQLQNTFGWEIGSHTVNHRYLATSDPTDQPYVLTHDQVIYELSQSKADLAAHGIDAKDFATPYGDYNMPVLAEIAKYYQSQRGFGDVNKNVWPYNAYLLNVKPVQEGVRVSDVKSAIDAAIANKQWLILVMHDIKVKPSRGKYDYEYGTLELDQIAAYVKSKQNAGVLKSANINDGFVKSDTNLLTNGSFDAGITSGWTTDAPANITADSGNNGSYPSPTNSIKLTSSDHDIHLFAPPVSVDSTRQYVLKNFLNVSKLTSGEVGFYIDEYDANGNWISGQYKTGEHSVFVEELNFSYHPTSANVKKASLQVIVTANSGIIAYLDNVQWLAF